LTLVCAGGYDGSVLSITVPGRSIDLAEVRDAATAIYGAAVRTPLVRLDLSDAGSPSELYLTLEVLQAFWLVQDRVVRRSVRSIPDRALSRCRLRFVDRR
jgi:hypothetical protein